MEEGTIKIDSYKKTDNYIQYEIKTESSIVFRRFTEFETLHEILLQKYLIILPNIPKKQNLRDNMLNKYDEEFIDRRRILLEKYLNRLKSNEIVQKTKVFKSFISEPEFSFKATNASTGETETSTKDEPELSDEIINLFSRIKTKNEKYEKIKNQFQLYGNHMKLLESVYRKDLEYSRDICGLLKAFTSSLAVLYSMEGVEVADVLTKIEGELLMMDQIDSFDLAIEIQLGYVQSVFKLLQQRDFKQIDYEDLVTMKDKLQTELIQLKMNKSGSVTGYLKEKYDETIRGQSVEKTRTERMQKIQSKLSELELELENSLNVCKEIDEGVLLEIKKYQSQRDKDLTFAIKETARKYHRLFSKWCDLFEPLTK